MSNNAQQTAQPAQQSQPQAAKPANGTPTAEQKLIAELQAKIAQLEAAKSGTLTFKVSEKGAVSVYGLGKFPVTLYESQWLRLLGAKETLLAYMKAHTGELARKSE